VPPHIHTTQDELIRVLEGRFDLVLDGKPAVATAGDLIRMPMNVMHGIWNKSEAPVRAPFWVSPRAASRRCSGASATCPTRRR